MYEFQSPHNYKKALETFSEVYLFKLGINLASDGTYMDVRISRNANSQQERSIQFA